MRCLYSGALALERHDLRHRDGRRLFVYGELRGDLSNEPEPADREGEADSRIDVHRRFDQLTGTWVVVAPRRNVRPLVGMTGTGAATGSAPEAGPETAAACPLCPGGPEVPFGYDAAVFENRYPSLVAEPPPVPVPDDPRFGPAQGRCEVVLYTERHTGSLATLSSEELARVVAIWRDRSQELWADERHRFVMAFENRGAAVGTTLSHPHGQIYAFDHVPTLIDARVGRLLEHRNETGECLTCTVLTEDELGSGRTVAADEHFLVTVPFAPHWPYEVHVRAKRHGAGRLTDLGPAELTSLSGALRVVVERYDGLFGFELPYMMVILEAPTDAPDWHLAAEFLPPNRTERLLKIRASVETATGLFINDTVPESSAARLRAVDVAAREEVSVPDVVAGSATLG